MFSSLRSPWTMRHSLWTAMRIPLVLVWGLLSACQAPEEEPHPVALGPVDGHELPAVDTLRVGVGDRAPDFTLDRYPEGALSLSEFRGTHEVILVFYRGHW